MTERDLLFLALGVLIGVAGFVAWFFGWYLRQTERS